MKTRMESHNSSRSNHWRNWVQTWAGAIFGHIHWCELRKNQCDCYIKTDIDLGMKYKRFHCEIQSSMVTATREYGSVFNPSLSVFYEDHNYECPLTKKEQFAKCCFGEISNQRSTISPYIWNK